VPTELIVAAVIAAIPLIGGTLSGSNYIPMNVALDAVAGTVFAAVAKYKGK
jgi:hypothetical protein